MSIFDEMSAFVGGSVSDTGLLASAWTITFRDGSVEDFNGARSDYDSDDEGTAVMLHCKLTGEPELLDRVVSSTGTIYHITQIKQDLGTYNLTLARDTRYVQ